MGRILLDGVGIDALSLAAAADEVVRRAARGAGGLVVTPNADILLRVRRDPTLRALLDDAELVVADGVPLLWAARLAGEPLPGRVNGTDLLVAVAERCGRAGLGLFLLGGTPATPSGGTPATPSGGTPAATPAARAADRLAQICPGLALPGWYSPPFGFENDPEEIDRIEAALAAARPTVCAVGLGFPKQERLAAALRQRFPAVVFCCLGSAIGLVGGEQARAPRWAQRAGLEWLFRLAQEPRRLARRYLRDDLPFVIGLFLRSRRRGPTSRAPG
ncbi:MAG TPA: WecB/TagA/CpsF family glycosyltransferase [Mycobacteriales bacterium]|nr:WecB/TagA/CpsF family glycosyltransferase [Mycobacteriales bacterium]